MSSIKVEGSIGLLARIHDEERAPETECARFARLMLSTLPPAADRRVIPTCSLPASQHYRVVGGLLNGIECEVSEFEGAIRLRVSVHRPALYQTLKALTEWLELQLQYPGYAVTLEIHYVERGA